jgi:hypothetical protein
MTAKTNSLLNKPAMPQTQLWSHAFGRVNSISGSSGFIEGSGYA